MLRKQLHKVIDNEQVRKIATMSRTCSNVHPEYYTRAERRYPEGREAIRERSYPYLLRRRDIVKVAYVYTTEEALCPVAQGRRALHCR